MIDRLRVLCDEQQLAEPAEYLAALRWAVAEIDALVAALRRAERSVEALGRAREAVREALRICCRFSGVPQIDQIRNVLSEVGHGAE